MKVGGGLLIVMVCSINLYFVVIYVTALHSVWLYVMAALLCVSYLTFVGYLVGRRFYQSTVTLAVTPNLRISEFIWWSKFKTIIRSQDGLAQEKLFRFGFIQAQNFLCIFITL